MCKFLSETAGAFTAFMPRLCGFQRGSTDLLVLQQPDRGADGRSGRDGSPRRKGYHRLWRQRPDRELLHRGSRGGHDAVEQSDIVERDKASMECLCQSPDELNAPDRILWKMSAHDISESRADTALCVWLQRLSDVDICSLEGSRAM